MSLKNYHQNIDNFIQRIKQVLQLQEDADDIIPHRKNIITWIQQSSNHIKEEKQKQKKNQNFLTDLIKFTGLSSTNKIEIMQANLQRIKNMMSFSIIDFQEKDLQEMQIPVQIIKSLKHLKKKPLPQYYAIVSCPLFKCLFLKRRQSFDKCIKERELKGLKLMNLGFQGDNLNVVKYQRNALEQLLYTFCDENQEYSIVMKLQVENKNLQKNFIQSFCYIQDVLCKKDRIYKNMQQVMIEDEQNKNIYLQVDKKVIQIDQMSLLYSIISQMIILPIQSFATDYLVQIYDQSKQKKARIIKSRKSLTNAQYQKLKKQHPSLRNPLLYFNKFIKFHQYNNKQLVNPSQLKMYYSNFYQILNIIIQYLLNDFNVKNNNNNSNSSNNKINSLAFDQNIFQIIWQIVHKIVQLPNWIDQIINPIKEGCSLFQIIHKMCPIFNQIIKYQKSSYDQFKNNILNLPIENYLTLNVSKITIQQYKDMYVAINSVQYINNNSKNQIFHQIFYKTVKNYDITIVNIYEALYFLNFISKNYNQIYHLQNIHPSWKNKKIWRQILKLKNKQYYQLPFIGIQLQILAFSLGIDAIQNSLYPFQSIENNIQNQQIYQNIQILIKILKKKYQKKSNKYLSILLQKSFIKQKYKISQFLINKSIHINNFQYIFHVDEKRKNTLSKQNEKKKIILLMKNKQPQMFRRYQWQQLINVKLKDKTLNEKDDVVVVNTINKGNFIFKKSMNDNLSSMNLMNNTISRRDYMFCNNRIIAKLNVKDTQAYLQITQYPLLRYFYMFFLEKIEKSSLSLNFCGFFVQNGTLVHLIQSIPQCFNFQKGISTYTQLQLKNFTKVDQISQAIIISMILLPTNILLKNIIISPQLPDVQKGQQKKNLFIIDFNDFYQKNGFQSKNGEIMLKVKNSLFLFQEMKSSISQKIMLKYSSLDIFQVINSVIKQSIEFIKQINVLKIKTNNLNVIKEEQLIAEEKQKQLFSLIFQKGFLAQLAQRMFKIKNIFQKVIKNKCNISHLQLFQKINPELSYYYEQIINTTPKLIDRQRLLLDEKFKKSFLINTKFINFVGNSYKIEEVKDIFPNHYGRFNFEGPSQNLAHLYNNILKFDVYTKKISEIKDYNHDVIEYLIRHIDLSNYQKEQKDALLIKMQEYSKEYLNRQNKCLPLSIVRINNIQNIKQKSFKFMEQRLQQIILEDAKCSQSQFNHILKKFNSINNLKLINVSGIEKIGELMINISDNLVMKNLKHLSIVGCPDIASVDLSSGQLQHVTFRKNKSLTEIYIFSKKLKNMDCSQCPKLRLENIGIYIFKNINVLLCQNSCDGDIKRLQDKDYSIFLTRILRYLFNRFEQSTTYKVELIITLIKLELIDEKLFGFKNQAINKSLFNLITNARTEIINVVQTQIFDIFLQNSELDLLNLHQLLKIQISSLKVMENYLQKLINQKEKSNHLFKKHFKSLNFKDFINIPPFYNQHLSFIDTAINFIQVDKTFKFIFSISMDITLQQYITYINILNKKQNLQKLQLIIHDSIITNQFIEFIFSLDHHSKNAISHIQFHNCKIQVKNNVQIANQFYVKSIVFNKCNQINNISFMKFFINLQFLQLNSCIIQKISPFYNIMGGFSQLDTLSLINLKQNIKQNNMELGILFSNLKKMPKLQILNFTKNKLTQHQLYIFNDQLQTLKIKQLNLFQFYDEKIAQQCFQKFIKNQYIKLLKIQFKIKNQKLIHSFIDSLSKNKSIIQLYLKTDQEIQSIVFQKLKNNKKLEGINSNQNFPNWLKNHIATNVRNRSTFQYNSMREEITYGSKNQDFFRIGLSLDGGGVKGMLLASQLDYLSTKVGKPLHKIFDIIGGTSIGGILSIASTATLDGHNSVCTTSDLVDIFEIYSTKIFKKSQFGSITNILQTKYDVKSFQDLLIGYLKQSKLSDVVPSTNVIVTAVNRLTNQDVIFRSINAIFDRNLDYYMKDIARATSAAPTYFPSAQIKNIQATQKYSLIDGGVGLNNPSKLVIDDLIKITQNQSNKKNYFLLSLGTGKIKTKGIPSHAGIKDLAPIIQSFTQSANYFIEKDLSQNYKGHYLRLSPLVNLKKSQAELDNTDPEILKVYKDTGANAAQQYFSNMISFGKYKNESLIQWLQQNTDRKYQI